MNSDRFLITDRMWELMEPYCLGKPSDPGRTGSDYRLFWKRSCGLPARTAHGGTCQKSLASGTRYSSGFANGSNAMYSTVCSTP